MSPEEKHLDNGDGSMLISTPVKCEKTVDGNEYLLERPVVNPKLPSWGNETSIFHLKEPGYTIQVEMPEVVDEGSSIQPCFLTNYKPSDGNEVFLKMPAMNPILPSSWNDNGMLHLNEAAYAIKAEAPEMVYEGNDVQSCFLPNYDTEDRNEEFLEMPEPAFAVKAEVPEMIDEGTSVQPSFLPSHKTVDGNEELLEMPAMNPNLSNSWNDTGMLNLNEPSYAIKVEVPEMLDEGINDQPCFMPNQITEDGNEECPETPVVNPTLPSAWEDTGMIHLNEPALNPNLPNSWNDTGMLNLNEPAYAIKVEVPEMVDEGINNQPCFLPNQNTEDGNEECLETPVVNPTPPSSWKDARMLHLNEPAYPFKVDVSETGDEQICFQPCFLPNHNMEDENEDFLDMPVEDFEIPSSWNDTSICHLKEPGYAIKVEGAEVVDEGMGVQPCLLPTHETVDRNEEPVDIPVVNPDSPNSWRDTGMVHLNEPASAIKVEVLEAVAEETSVQPSILPNHQIPPTLVQEEQLCPSCKRVSPDCGLTADCGHKLPGCVGIQDKQLNQCETISNIYKDVVMNDVNQIKEEPDAGNASKDKIPKGVKSRKRTAVLKDPSKGHKGACLRNTAQAHQLSKSYETKEQEEASEDNHDDEQNMGMECDHAESNNCNFSPMKSDARRSVRDTLRLFHGVLRKLVQAQEKQKMGRVDASLQLHAALKIFKDHGKYINVKKQMGPIPGVEIGDLFKYRVELDIIGLHKPVQSGIDFIKQDKKYLAVSVVASGRYDNDVVNSDVLIYTGQGGNVAGGCKQLEDQKLERGNLALKNSIDMKNLVRVIRGFKERKMTNRVRTTTPSYIYDGLYFVERYWQEPGRHGKLIYKFEMRRAPNQPELNRKKVKQPKKTKFRKGRRVDKNSHDNDTTICVEISKGEKTPILAVNTIDNVKPPPFTYITKVKYPDWCRPIPPKGCDCKDGCLDSKNCACSLKNGGEIPFNHSGVIVEQKSLVYECGPLCKCPPTCHNRVSQHGIKLPLEVFKTETRGWGVRCLSSISSGSFVCEYIGELLDDKEAEERIGSDDYLFDIGLNYNDSTLRDGLSALIPDMPSSHGDVVESVGFTLDAGKYGNVGRFINHSCSPNLFAQNVLYDHEDKRIPHIMLFAGENIPPLQELTYHYNYAIDQVFDSEGNIKKKSCYCGSSECIGRMY